MNRYYLSYTNATDNKHFCKITRATIEEINILSNVIFLTLRFPDGRRQFITTNKQTFYIRQVYDNIPVSEVMKQYNN